MGTITTRVYAKCGMCKVVDQFVPLRGDGETKTCLRCRKIQIRYHSKAKTQPRTVGPNHTLPVHGLKRFEYEEMLFKQKGGCAICKQAPGLKKLAVDHCHSTGKIRGLLCTSCNISLGGFKDNVNYLTRAIEYLSKDYSTSKIHRSHK